MESLISLTTKSNNYSKMFRTSKSPYTSLAWIVEGLDNKDNKNKRLVIDFRKIKERNIADRYSIPSILMILDNLGKAKFFTTLGLKSPPNIPF